MTTRGLEMTLSDLVGDIDKTRDNAQGNLSSAIRVFVLKHWHDQPRPA